MDNMMELFTRDSRNNINQLVDSLIQFKKDAKEKRIIENAFRAAHSIKTEASYLQLDDITNLSHEIENELEIILTKKIDFSKEKYDSLIEKTEMLQEMIEMAVEDNVSDSDDTEIDDNLVDEEIDSKEPSETEVIQSKNDNKVSAGSKKTHNSKIFFYKKEEMDEQIFDEFQLYLLSEAMKRGEKLYRITCDILPDSAMKYARLYLIVNNLELHCNLVKTIPVIDVSKLDDSMGKGNRKSLLSNPNIEENTRITCYVTTSKSYDQLYNIVNVDEVKNIQIINIPYEPHLSNNSQQESLENMMSAPKTIAARVDRLDLLFSSIHKMRMDLNIKYSYLNEEAVSLFDRNLETMQESINHLRMATLSDEFSSMPSLINKIAFSKGKDANVVFDDNNIEIDRSVFEYIYDPIIHIFKNAIDHGIETIEERKAKGKNPKGKIECKTYLEDDRLIIRISDDGKGMDFTKIAEKSGFSESELRQSNKLLSVISSPGFTTKEDADEHSGRGFGMNLVCEKVAKIKGALLEIDSKEDIGTAITIKLSDNYIARDVLYFIFNEEIIATPSDVIEEEIESLRDISKTDNNQIMYKNIPVYTKEGVLFSNKINSFNKFKGILINKDNKKGLILCDKILFNESIPVDRVYLIKSSLPYLFLIKISGLDDEYYYLDSSLLDG
ncbi:MAG: ATP-binding protein [Spirochaetaceae bacterium]|nr:ATP-binding protein [Spirochaetaceae bacterium]